MIEQIGEYLISLFFHGVVGLALMAAFFIPIGERKSEKQILSEENQKLKRQAKQLHGRHRYQQDEVSFLRLSRKKSNVQEKQNQLSQEKLNGELVRRERLIRSLEFELQQEQKKSMGRR